ncbi:MAG: hypothetical protein ACI4J6_00570 [Oscillospiraceae bacterium]
MKLKKIAAAFCAAAMAFTQTAFVPLNVSAEVTPSNINNIYFDIGMKTAVSNGTWTASESARSSEPNNSVWLGSYSDDQTDMQFYFKGRYNGDAVTGESYNFTATNLKIEASKEEREAGKYSVELNADSRNDANAPTTDNIVNVDMSKFENAAESNGNVTGTIYYTNFNSGVSEIRVSTYNFEDNPSINSGSGSVDFSAPKSFVQEFGLRIDAPNVYISDVKVDFNATTSTETLFDETSFTWTETYLGAGDYNGVIPLTFNELSFSNLGDFKANGSIKATWDSIICTTNTYSEGDLWSGSMSFGGSPESDEYVNVKESVLSAADLKKGGRITINVTKDTSVDNGYCSLTFKYPDGCLSGVTGFEGNSYSLELTEELLSRLSGGNLRIRGQHLTITSVTYEAPPELSTFTVNDGENDTECESWSEVLAAVNDKSKDFTITLNSDVEAGKITFPSASKAKSVTITSGEDENAVHTLNITNSSLSIPTDVTFINAAVEREGGFTITAGKNVTVEGFKSETLTELKGGSGYTLTINMTCEEGNSRAGAVINYAISGFGVIEGNCVAFNNTVTAGTYRIIGSDNSMLVGTASVTFNNIESDDTNGLLIVYNTENFTPVTVTGNITGKVWLAMIDGGEELGRFTNGQTVLTAPDADLSKLVVPDVCLPSGNVEYTLERKGSDVVISGAVFQLVRAGGNGTTKYASWYDAVAEIESSEKAAPGGMYAIMLLGDADVGGALTMPKTKTYQSLIIGSQNTNDIKTLTFTGNITLTGNTAFWGLGLDSVKNKESVPFSITAGKNGLMLNQAEGRIKNVTSSGLVQLYDTNIEGNVTGGTVIVGDGSIISANSTNSANAFNEINAAEGAVPSINAFEPSEVDGTDVTVGGNLTAREVLGIADQSLTVKGVINAKGIVAGRDAGLVVYKGRRVPLDIGKDGFYENSQQLSLTILDPETDKTVQITEDTVIGSIDGKYADQLVPDNRNLDDTEADSYYIIKSGKKLIAKPKNAEGLVEVSVNGKTAYYKSLEDAVKDINSTGKKTDSYVIKLNGDISASKLPLPYANRYKKLTFTSDRRIAVTVRNDITLTGDLLLDKGVNVKKVNSSGEQVPISVNVGKYNLEVYQLGCGMGEKNYIANISGSGTFKLGDFVPDTFISGNVDVGTFILPEVNHVFLGDNASFDCDIEAGNRKNLAYPSAIADRVKLGDINGELAILFSDRVYAEGDKIAVLTGDLIDGQVMLLGTDLVPARSGNDLVAVKRKDVVIVETIDESSNWVDRLYDSLESAMQDITRLNCSNEDYLVVLPNRAEYNVAKLPLPAAGTYNSIKLLSPEDCSATINVSSDITLTGDLIIEGLVTVNKVSKGKVVPISINAGSYDFEGLGHLSPEDYVSQIANISSTGIVAFTDDTNVSGKIKVGQLLLADDMTLGEKASFEGSITAENDSATLKYPLSIAKKVKLNEIQGTHTLTVDIEGVKAGDKIACITGDFVKDSVKIKNSDLVVVRSGNYLVAAKAEDVVEVKETGSEAYRCYDSIENAIKDITRLNAPDSEYELYLPGGEYNLTKLALPAKGKYKSITLYCTSGNAVINVKNDITLTGDLFVGNGVTLRKVKNFGDEAELDLRFTSPRKKDGSPVYTVKIYNGGMIKKGTLNGGEIENVITD